MIKRFSLLSASILLASVLTQQAQAQGPARLESNSLIGNQAGGSGQFILQVAPSNVAGAYLHLVTNDNSNTQYAGSVSYVSGYNPNASSVAHSFFTRSSNGGWNSNFTVFQNGQIRIGVQAPTTQTDYRLAVDGKIVSKSVYVTNPTAWADFVFAPAYRCMPLPELEAYIQRNKHLPFIPSASQVEANGYSVTEMDAKLLQTVEELTLQVIRLSKEIEQLKSQSTIAVRQK